MIFELAIVVGIATSTPHLFSPHHIDEQIPAVDYRACEDRALEIIEAEKAKGRIFVSYECVLKGS
jgi:hypothetical protein